MSTTPSRDEGMAIQGTVAEVLKLLDGELTELLVRRGEVAKRIRSVELAIGSLQEVAQLATAGSDEIPNGHNSVPAPTTTRDGTGSRAGEWNKRANDSGMELRRACRIALFENSSPMSVEEICERIRRRGSFTFSSVDSARPAIIHELNMLAAEGLVS